MCVGVKPEAWGKKEVRCYKIGYSNGPEAHLQGIRWCFLTPHFGEEEAALPSCPGMADDFRNHINFLYQTWRRCGLNSRAVN